MAWGFIGMLLGLSAMGVSSEELEKKGAALVRAKEGDAWQKDPAYLAFREASDRSWLFERWLKPQIQVTPLELKKYWDQFQKTYGSHQVRVQRLWLQNLGQVSELQKRWEAGSSFVQLVEAFSADPDASIHGGELGWVNRYQMDPLLFQAALLGEERKLLGPFSVPEGGGVFLFVLGKKWGRLWSYLESEGDAWKDLKESLRRKALQKLSL